MTERTPPRAGSLPHVDSRDPDQRAQELREEIERTRDELGQTVAELAHKADLKGRLRERTEQMTQPIRSAGSQLANGTRKTVRWHPVPLAAALTALVIGLLGYLWWRRH